jgi:ATP-dependent helicase YprA (DUF1998 family)
MVRAQSGASAAVCRPERLIENVEAKDVLEGTLSRVVDTHPESADELVRHLRETLAARSGEPSEVLVHERCVAALPPTLGVLRPQLPRPLARALLGQGIRQLYAHQVATVEALRAGQNVVLASPTASGKSRLCAAHARAHPSAARSHAVYLYPTKPDRRSTARCRRGQQSGRHWPRVAVLGGDTPRETRRSCRGSASHPTG